MVSELVDVVSVTDGWWVGGWLLVGLRKEGWLTGVW